MRRSWLQPVAIRLACMMHSKKPLSMFLLLDIDFNFFTTVTWMSSQWRYKIRGIIQEQMYKSVVWDMSYPKLLLNIVCSITTHHCWDHSWDHKCLNYCLSANGRRLEHNMWLFIQAIVFFTVVLFSKHRFASAEIVAFSMTEVVEMRYCMVYFARYSIFTLDRCGRKAACYFVAHLIIFKSTKSVKIWHSYCKNQILYFLSGHSVHARLCFVMSICTVICTECVKHADHCFAVIHSCTFTASLCGLNLSVLTIMGGLWAVLILVGRD